MLVALVIVDYTRAARVPDENQLLREGTIVRTSSAAGELALAISSKALCSHSSLLNMATELHHSLLLSISLYLQCCSFCGVSAVRQVQAYFTLCT